MMCLCVICSTCNVSLYHVCRFDVCLHDVLLLCPHLVTSTMNE